MPNFFKKLTGSLKMPAEEELFEDTNPQPQEPKPSPPPASSLPREEADQQDIPDEDVEARPVSFKKMLASEEEEPEISFPEEEEPQEAPAAEGRSIDEPEPAFEDNSAEDEPAQTAGVVANFAKARTASRTPVKRSSRKSSSRLKVKKSSEDDGEFPSPEGQLAIDVYETPEEIVIKSTIAGVKPEDLDVGIEDNTLNIRGSRHNEERVKGEDYFYQECYWGTFSRSVILPVEVDSDKTKASLKDGILTIRLPKIIKEKEKKIKIFS